MSVIKYRRVEQRTEKLSSEKLRVIMMITKTKKKLLLNFQYL